MIKLSREAEPEIYATTRRFGTVLENVVIDPATGALDLDDGTLHREHARLLSARLHPERSADGHGGHPENIVMLTADAFGVLPPISQLTPEQAMYHFLSGYTARVAGTEKGVTEPQATFSTCFGAPFMPRHPTVYAKMLGEKMARQHVECWLVNTGWSGGGYRRRRAHVDPPHPRHGARGARRHAGRVRRARPTRTSACRCRAPARTCRARC